VKVPRVFILIALVTTLLSHEKDAKLEDTLTERLDKIIGMQERHVRTAKMRGFLWDHWSRRKPATRLLTSVSKEGQVAHSEYKILLLPGNALMLKVATIRDRRGYGQVIPKRDGGDEAYTVERVSSKNPYGVGTEASAALATDVSVASNKYWLRFKGWGGTLITYF
jgi:hypothetical protein